MINKRTTIIFFLLMSLLLACEADSDDDESSVATATPAPAVNATEAPTEAPDSDPQPILTAQQLQVVGSGTVAETEWSPTGRYLAAAGGAGVLLYDSADFRLAPRLLPVLGGAAIIEFSPDGSRIAVANGQVDSSGGVLQFVALFDVETGSEIATIPTGSERVSDLEFSPDGTLLAGGLFQEVRIWDGTDLSVVNGLPAARKPTVVAIAEDNQRIAFYDGAGDIVVLPRDAPDNPLVITLNTDQGPTVMAFINDDQELMIGGEFLNITIYNATDGSIVYEADQMVLNPQMQGNQFLFGADASSTFIIDLAAREDVLRVDVPRGDASPTRELVAARQVEFVEIYDADGVVVVAQMPFLIIDQPPFYVAETGFLAGYRLGDDNLLVFDVNDFTVIDTITHPGRILGRNAALSPDGTRYAALSVDDTLQVYDTATLNIVSEFVHEPRSSGLAISPDNQQLATIESGLSATVRVWNIADGALILESQLSLAPELVYYTPTGTLLVIGGQEAAVIDAPTGDVITTFGYDNHRLPVGAVFTPSGDRLLIYGGDGGRNEAWITAYDVRNGYQLVESVNGFHRFSITGVAFSADGSTMYTVGEDTFLNQWDADSLAFIDQIEIFVDEMNGIVALNDDATQLLTVTERGVVQVWELGAE